MRKNGKGKEEKGKKWKRKEENEEKWKREGRKWGKIENFMVKKDWKKLRTFFFFFFFLLFTFRKWLKLLRGLQKWNFLPEKNQEKWLCPHWEIFLLRPCFNNIGISTILQLSIMHIESSLLLNCKSLQQLSYHLTKYHKDWNCIITNYTCCCRALLWWINQPWLG